MADHNIRLSVSDDESVDEGSVAAVWNGLHVWQGTWVAIYEQAKAQDPGTQVVMDLAIQEGNEIDSIGNS